ncbi:hypothetical protein INR49_021751 [Caranx melampygus]|nr:hypothetical protein INR49_021751 [Caranx melampygus]
MYIQVFNTALPGPQSERSPLVTVKREISQRFQKKLAQIVVRWEFADAVAPALDVLEAGLLVLVRAGRDLDHKNHRVFCLVAECAANYIHGVLMGCSLQTLTVHRQQLIPCLQMQSQVTECPRWVLCDESVRRKLWLGEGLKERERTVEA